MGELPEESLEKDRGGVDILLLEVDRLSSVDFLDELLDVGSTGRSPEYSLGLQTVGLLEEVDAGHHDGGDGAVLVVNDPLQGDTELLAMYPAGHGEVGGGHGLGQPVLLLVVLPHRVGYGQGVDVHVLLQLGEMIDVLDFTSEFCTDDGLEEI